MVIYSSVAAAMITASIGSCPSPSEQSAVQISSLLSFLTERRQENTVVAIKSLSCSAASSESSLRARKALLTSRMVLGSKVDHGAVLQDLVGSCPPPHDGNNSPWCSILEHRSNYSGDGAHRRASREVKGNKFLHREEIKETKVTSTCITCTSTLDSHANPGGTESKTFFRPFTEQNKTNKSIKWCSNLSNTFFPPQFLLTAMWVESLVTFPYPHILSGGWRKKRTPPSANRVEANSSYVHKKTTPTTLLDRNYVSVELRLVQQVSLQASQTQHTNNICGHGKHCATHCLVVKT